MPLSPLQQRFYDLVEVEQSKMGLCDAELASDLAGIKEGIKTMNAAELRQNIKAWTGASELENTWERSADRNQRKVEKRSAACRSNSAPCPRRQASVDNCCEHYPA